MATFADLEGEIETVANAFTSINHYVYDERGSINWESRTKSYPILLLDKKVRFEPTKYKNGLPVRSTWFLTIYLMDDYNTSEKSTISLSDKQSALKVIGDQYFAELITRNQSTLSGLMIGRPESTLGSFKDEVHNNKVIEITYNLEVEIIDTDCILGTFTYPSSLDNLVFEDGNNFITEDNNNLIVE